MCSYNEHESKAWPKSSYARTQNCSLFVQNSSLIHYYKGEGSQITVVNLSLDYEVYCFWLQNLSSCNTWILSIVQIIQLGYDVKGIFHKLE